MYVCLMTGVCWVTGLIFTVLGGCGFDLVLIACNGLVLVLSSAGAGRGGFAKRGQCRTLLPISASQVLPYLGFCG